MMFDISPCEGCPFRGSEPVPSFVPPRASQLILFVGEAPGKSEMYTGIPFSGESGKLLRTLLRQFGIEEKSALTNAVRCYSPDRGNIQEAARYCRLLLHKEVEELCPDVIVCLGQVACDAFREARKGYVTVGGKKIPIVTTVNPAYVLRMPSAKTALRLAIARAKSLLNPTKQPLPDIPYKVITTAEEAAACLETLRNNETVVSVDYEIGFQPGVKALAHDPAGRCLCVGIGTERQAYAFLMDGSDIPFSLFVPLLTDTRVLKVCHRAQFEILWTWRWCKRWLRPVADTALIAYVIDENEPTYSLKALAMKHFSIPDYTEALQPYVKQDGNYANVPRDLLLAYCAADAWFTYHLYQTLAPSLSPSDYQLLSNLLIPATYLYAHAEDRGILFDKEAYPRVLGEYKRMLFDIGAELQKHAGAKFNPLSPQQVAHHLYTVMKLPVLKYTTKGNPSTDDTVLKALSEQYPDAEFLQLLLNYRHIAKIISTYLERLPDFVCTDDRIRPSFHLTGTVSGRIVCSSPALQTLPAKSTPSGRALWSLLIPSQGHVFVEVDASQHELRTLAVLSKDERMIAVLMRGEDIHRWVAATFFGKDVKDVTPEERRVAKSYVFGIIYGMTVSGLAGRLGISMKEAERLMSKLKRAFPQAMKWLQEQERLAREVGVLTTPTGRKRHLVDVLSIDESVKRHALREARNFCVQSFASDVWLYVALQYTKAQMKAKLDSPIVITIHDSFIIDADKERLEEVLQCINNAVAAANQQFSPTQPIFRAEYKVYDNFANDPIEQGELDGQSIKRKAELPQENNEEVREYAAAEAV